MNTWILNKNLMFNLYYAQTLHVNFFPCYIGNASLIWSKHWWCFKFEKPRIIVVMYAWVSWKTVKSESWVFGTLSSAICKVKFQKLSPLISSSSGKDQIWCSWHTERKDSTYDAILSLPFILLEHFLSFEITLIHWNW